MKPIVLPELLIEYLVVGSSALIWVALLAGPTVHSAGKEIPALYLIAIAPSIYALGMMVEFLALALVSFPPNRSIKGAIRNIVRTRLKLKDGDNADNGIPLGEQTTRRQIRLLLDATEQSVPQVVEEVSMRSSRDRIARGTSMNLLIMAVVFCVLPEASLPALAGREVLIAASFAGFAATAFMWVYFEANSYAYELRLAVILEERAARHHTEAV